MPHHVTSLFDQQMNWEAVATFSAGVLAVLAALAIGFLQSKIIARQTRIQEVTLRHELWERRFNDVYTPVMKMLSGIDFAHADPNHETKLAFLRAIEQSRFLFESKGLP